MNDFEAALATVRTVFHGNGMNPLNAATMLAMGRLREAGKNDREILLIMRDRSRKLSGLTAPLGSLLEFDHYVLVMCGFDPNDPEIVAFVKSAEYKEFVRDLQEVERERTESAA